MRPPWQWRPLSVTLCVVAISTVDADSGHKPTFAQDSTPAISVTPFTSAPYHTSNHQSSFASNNRGCYRNQPINGLTSRHIFSRDECLAAISVWQTAYPLAGYTAEFIDDIAYALPRTQCRYLSSSFEPDIQASAYFANLAGIIDGSTLTQSCNCLGGSTTTFAPHNCW